LFPITLPRNIQNEKIITGMEIRGRKISVGSMNPILFEYIKKIGIIPKRRG